MRTIIVWGAMSVSRRRVLQAAAAFAVASPLAVQAEDAGLTVVATTGMIADAARAIGGGHVEVTALMGPGVDPHAYRQTRSDIVLMARADLVLYHGLRLEAQLLRFFEDLSSRVPVVAVAEQVPQDGLIPAEEYQDAFDPHLWMDPALWTGVVRAVSEALQSAVPEKAAAFEANAQSYIREIEQLGVYARDTLSSVPQEARVLVTAHDAFAYFGQAYGFDVEGIQGISTESEAGLARIAELVNLLVTREVSAVFVESSVSDRNVRALIEGAAARGHRVEIGGELFSDAMGPQGTYEGTYIGMIDHNATTISRALGGSAPERGRLGQLSTGS